MLKEKSTKTPKTRIVRHMIQGKLVYKAQVRLGFFWMTITPYYVIGGRSQETAVGLCKAAIDDYLKFGGEEGVIIYPENQ